MPNSPRLRRFGACLVAIGLAAALAACGSSDPTGPSGDVASGSKIVVGGFAYPESDILAEIYYQALDAKGFDVDKRLDIGPRQQTIPALQDGSINLIPEYNGNLLAFFNTKYTERTTADVDAALPGVLDKNAKNGVKLQVLDSAQAEDKDAYVVTRKTADANNLTEIGDLSALEPFVLGANPQFGELGYGIPGLAKVYGVSKVKFKPIEDFGGPDTVKALVDNSVQVADIYTTSPAIKTDDLVVLDDPKNMISSQNIIPLLSTKIYSEKLADVLNSISAKLTTDGLIALRNRVEGDEKASASTAAKDWLKDNGLT